ncbi:MAG: PhoH family protein [Thermicanus sp.]|nr:PhoH family protein [Thermicanus sp.]
MNKIYVLDTSVLLQEPNAVFMFYENDVVIPSVVLEEIDMKKRNMDEVGHNARKVARILDSLRSRGKLHDGIPMERGGTLRVELNHRSLQSLKDYFVEPTNDHRILAVALNLQEEERDKEEPKQVVIVSKDALMRIKADALNLAAEDFLSDRVILDEKGYTGTVTLEVDPGKINLFYHQGFLAADEIDETLFYPHQFVFLKDQFGSSRSAIGKVSADKKRIHKLRLSSDENVWGIRPRNAQQWMALDLLLDPEIPLVTIIGKAGTGKTLLSLAAGLSQVEDEHRYKKLLVTRPIVPLGKDIGYLPGEKEEKLRPWIQPIYDNLEFLFNTKNKGDLDKILAGINSIQIEALTYIRGRSIPEQFILIDEAQNLTKHEVKTILTRVGEGSKIVLMGDPQQIDHPYLDSFTNGLVYVAEKFKEYDISGHIRLEKGERSTLAQLAADIL